MADASPLKPTSRAYTFRLRPYANNREAFRLLWRTHLVVNKGAEAFGDWLLTLRGGLDHRLAEDVSDELVAATIKRLQKKKNDDDDELLDDEPEQAESTGALDPSEVRRKLIVNRRRTLALSWLSVETTAGSPEDYRVENHKTVDALRDILKSRNLDSVAMQSWIDDCTPAITARIRSETARRKGDIAVWVNRSRMFDDRFAEFEVSETAIREIPWDLLDRFFLTRNSYFEFPLLSETSDRVDGGNDDKSTVAVKGGGRWLSERLGDDSKGTDFRSIGNEYLAFAEFLDNWNQTNEVDCEKLSDLLRQKLGIEVLPTRLAATSGESNMVQTYYETTVKSFATGKLILDFDRTEMSKIARQKADEKFSLIGRKGHRAWSDALIQSIEDALTVQPFMNSLQYIGNSPNRSKPKRRQKEYCVMLDHAARRLCQTHSWVKRAEASRELVAKNLEKLDALNRVDPRIVAILDKYCDEQSTKMNADPNRPYLINRRALGGWEAVVQKWFRILRDRQNDSTDADIYKQMIEAVRTVQDELQENDKFGDGRLFENLAKVDLWPTWYDPSGNSVHPEWLLDYASGSKARADQKRFKVPVYCHPDALAHPVFCDFGNSRWSIQYARLTAQHLQPETIQAKLQKKEVEKQKLEARLASESNDAKKAELEIKVSGVNEAMLKLKHDLAIVSTEELITLGLWDGSKMTDVDFRGLSKRFRKDFPAPPSKDAPPSERTKVTRADRLGRAMMNIPKDSTSVSAAIFDDKEWNGRLQLPRAQLDRLARKRDAGKIDGSANEWLENQADQLNWQLSFTAEIPRYPNPSWEQLRKDKRNAALNITEDAFKNSYIHKEANKGRGSRAKIVLARVAGLRILSVDIGHRVAAACSVWLTMDDAEVRAECDRLGASAPSADQLFLHLQEGKRTHIFRRIAANTLDGKPHPACWARLERQFMIRLQGEKDVRVLQQTEREWVASLLRKMQGYSESHDLQTAMTEFGATRADWKYDRVCVQLLWKAQRLIGRLSSIAKIARAFRHSQQLSRANEWSATLDGDARVQLFQETLLNIRTLAKDSFYNSDRFAGIWDQDFATPLGIPATLTAELDEDDESRSITRSERRKLQCDRLKFFAQKLAASDSLEQHAEKWESIWLEAEQSWKASIRALRRLLIPKKGTAISQGRRRGGLSLDRVSSFDHLLRLMRAFHQRIQPMVGKDVIAASTPVHPAFGDRIRTKLEQLRTNRVKQLAGRILEAASGIGIESKKVGTRDPERPRERLDQALGDRFKPCHAIVIENLKRYKTDEGRPRMENQRLMSWSASNLRKRIEEGCEVANIQLRDAQPEYTSRKDFRTGQPGIRGFLCRGAELFGRTWNPHNAELHAMQREHLQSTARKLLDEFESSSPETPTSIDIIGNVVQNAFRKAAKKQSSRKAPVAVNLGSIQKLAESPATDQVEQYVLRLYLRLFKQLAAGNGEVLLQKQFFIPRKGGDIFVATLPRKFESKGTGTLDADLNASANIGLRALLDPDWSGAWDYLPCRTTDFVPSPDKLKGAACIGRHPLKSEPTPIDSSSPRKSRGSTSSRKMKELVNLWRFPSNDPVDANSTWYTRSHFDNVVLAQILDRLLSAATKADPSPPDIETPF
jgi:hypothetical protein